MQKLIVVLFCLVFPLFAFSQDDIPFYKNQFGYDFKPVLFVISDTDYDIFFEKEFTYRRAFTTKDYGIIKLSQNGEFRSDDFRSFATSDSTFITNRLFSYNNNSISLGYTRKIGLKYINLYAGGLTIFTQEQGETMITEFKRTDELEFLSQQDGRVDYYRIGFTPIIGVEFPITKRWSLLTNFYPTIDYTFGSWDFMNGNREIRTTQINKGFTFNPDVLQDITLLFSF